MPRYLSEVDVKGWIDEKKEEWNDPETMPDFWSVESWRERAAECCGIPVDELGYAPKEASASAAGSGGSAAAAVVANEKNIGVETSGIAGTEDFALSSALSSKSRKTSRRKSTNRIALQSSIV